MEHLNNKSWYKIYHHMLFFLVFMYLSSENGKEFKSVFLRLQS